MAETLTVDTTPDTETLGESLTSDEKESLAIGEKMVEQQEQLLAGKYKNAEELEKAYVELQQKLGSNDETVEEPPTEVKEEVKEEEPAASTFLDNLWEESQTDGDFKKETISKLNEMSQQDLAQEYLNYRASQTTEVTPEDIKNIKNIAGGDKGYNAMMSWANQNLEKGELEMFDTVLGQNNPLAAFFAVQALNYRYNDAMGVDGEMLTGKAAKAEQPGFRSQAELVAAMSDPRYDNDPAFRQDIISKLEQSKDLEF